MPENFWHTKVKMQEYDAALKLLFRRAAPRAIQLLSGTSIVQWLDVELPKTQNLRMDLLGEDPNGKLHHFEVQSQNDGGINLRMGEYKLGTKRLTVRFASQFVLYVGEAPMNMPTELKDEDGDFLARYRLIDIRELDGEALRASEDLGDNMIAILTRLRDHRVAIRDIVAKIAGLPESERHVTLQQLVVLAGLRRLAQTVNEEVQKMPLIIDLMENDLLGPAIRKGIEEGLAQGLEKGREEGRAAGEQLLLRRLIEKRFGPLPDWAGAKLASLSVAEIEPLAERMFDAASLDSLLNR